MENVPIDHVFDGERPVPTEWRETCERIISALASSDPRREIDTIKNVSFSDQGIETSLYQIEGYPAAKVSIGPKTWNTSFCTREENGWKMLIDLHVDGEAEISDLVLGVDVRAAADLFRFYVGFVYVP